MRRTRRRAAAPEVTPRFKVWIELDGAYVFGRGICEILKAVRETGSIKQSAASLGKSYRHVWDRVKEAERALGVALVETHVGGKDSHRSELTPLGQKLIDDFERLHGRMNTVLEREFASLWQSLRNSLANP